MPPLWRLGEFLGLCYNESMLKYRRANVGDLDRVCRFTDWWLAGRGRSKGVSGALDDYFISKGQHKKYVVKYTTWICLDLNTLVGWAVVEPSGTMIGLLVAANRRGEGIGKHLMLLSKPRFIRSKSDQSSGNPIGFYKKLGYRKVKRVRSQSRLDIDRLRPKRTANIDILELAS